MWFFFSLQDDFPPTINKKWFESYFGDRITEILVTNIIQKYPEVEDLIGIRAVLREINTVIVYRHRCLLCLVFVFVNFNLVFFDINRKYREKNLEV